MDAFIKCPGIVKDETIPTNWIKMDHRFYAIELKDRIILISWKDEKTIIFKYKTTRMTLELWSYGKKIKVFEFSHSEVNPTLFLASMDYCDILDNHIDIKWRNFLHE